jgi:hypothetical protein
MIYQLMKRDPAWKYVPCVILLSAVAGLLVGKYPGAVVIPVYAGSAAFACRPNQRATYFEATLPALGRQLLQARLSVILSMIWLPAIAGFSGILISVDVAGHSRVFASGHPAELARGLGAAAAAYTLAIMAMQSVRVREVRAPNWLPLVFYLAAQGTVMALFMFRPIVAPGLMACVPLSAALFLRIWRAVPKTFQLAPAGTAARAALVSRATASRGGEPVTAWLPILRSVWGAQGYGAVPVFCCLAAMQGQWIGACVLFPMGLWQGAPQRLRWALALPVKPRLVLWTILVPMLFPLAAGYYLGFHHGGRHPRPFPEPRIQVLTLAAIFAMALLAVLFSALLGWRRLRHVPLVVRRVVFGVALGVAALANFVFLVWPMAGAKTPIPDALPHLSRALPGSLAALIAAIALGALYWAVDRVFAEAEYADKTARG